MYLWAAQFKLMLFLSFFWASSWATLSLEDLMDSFYLFVLYQRELEIFHTTGHVISYGKVDGHSDDEEECNCSLRVASSLGSLGDGMTTSRLMEVTNPSPRTPLPYFGAPFHVNSSSQAEPIRASFGAAVSSNSSSVPENFRGNSIGSTITPVFTPNTTSSPLLAGTADHTDGVSRPLRNSTASPVAELLCGGTGVDSDTVWNHANTAKAARLAVGQVLCLAHK
ncbi:unnamed protein product [Protopolystoma xenopodis]|uniref:Uncharacterized protein n=1 Tax=Protopolystoma xenopodis TaxID=117903 RepID=A0A448WNK1_9PLAT|nr:unnamed protein product [Protopolystoma xenopodis]